MEQMIFYSKDVFCSGHFLVIFSDLMDKKMAGAKKVSKVKNLFYHARQPCEEIFEI